MVAAVGSYLDARHADGEWLVRIEDLDPPREVTGAAADMLRTLELYGFEWDGEILYQSSRLKSYREIADDLLSRSLAYRCSCSRKEIAKVASMGVEGAVYPGFCRTGHDPERNGQALRLKTDSTPIKCSDRVEGQVTQQLDRDVGDFLIQRGDGLTAYQLAVVVDDIYQNITHIVRGADLLLSTPRQIYIQQLLNGPACVYAHLPLVIDSTGKKLSCQGKAPSVPKNSPIPTLLSVLKFLRQPLPKEQPNTLSELWRWAISNWNIERITIHKT